MVGAAPSSSRWLYLQVLLGIALGALVGVCFPTWGVALRPLGELFVKLLKLAVAPLVFCTIVLGIAGAGDLRRAGRVGLKALLYFELMTTLALLLGLAVMHVFAPGVGMHVDANKLDGAALTRFKQPAHGLADTLLAMVPDSAVGAFTSGDVLGVVLLGTLGGVALARIGNRGAPAVAVISATSAVVFELVGLLMQLAPFGAFGAMAFTVGSLGATALLQLGGLLLSFYVTALLFVVLVLGGVVWLLGLSPLQLTRYFGAELLLVLGTSSSESALPRLLAKLERLGCERAVVGLVVPTGYSFNLDGTCIYLTMATLFLAQATDTPLTWLDEVTILGVLLVSSKGAAAVSGAGFVTLAATLGSTGKVPVNALVLLLGIDRFMSEARALVNLCGNVVATLVIARWEGRLDLVMARSELANGGRSTASPAATES